MDTIAIVDHTRKHRPEPGVLDAIAEALTTQIERDFAPAWKVKPRRVTVGGRGDKLHLFDTSHQADDYGWHIVDGHGDPYAHLFAGVSIKRGSTWVDGEDAISVTASHEVLEMLVDPAANEYTFNGLRTLWSREVCDPVQADAYRIVASGMRVAVSNFVLPAFFNPWAPGPYDRLGVLTEPFSIARGGYAIVERATRTREREARTIGVRFDRAVPKWQRTQKLEGWGRTFWRLALVAGSSRRS
ncbi:MAG TPA: hypothetical protein VFX21_09355 [Acidimicrobiia bacterium]|nr:hypothetical protein [Acidimicrobiia bacterium]